MKNKALGWHVIIVAPQFNNGFRFDFLLYGVGISAFGFALTPFYNLGSSK